MSAAVAYRFNEFAASNDDCFADAHSSAMPARCNRTHLYLAASRADDGSVSTVDMVLILVLATSK